MTIQVSKNIKGTKPGSTSVAVINLNHCREYIVEQEPKDDILEPLYPIDINIKGTKPGSTSVAVINLNHCREYIVEQEPKDDILEPLYPIDISKLKKRQMENEAEKKKEASFINVKASRIGQALFRDIKKTMNQVIRWSNNDILINNAVRIVEPYRVENVSIDSQIQSNTTTSIKASAKGDNDTKTHIIKLVEKFWSDQSKLTSNIDSTRTTKSDSSSKTTTTTTDSTSTASSVP
ncbi:unnamed protein product [Rotaria sordida]|uniref:AD domain-containing protein n=2 Tax=Rotaria sordida TaxID=392033 RepID=A0A814N0P5_9BILA|nr:unnamed protein product [Rotaria sordida]